MLPSISAIRSRSKTSAARTARACASDTARLESTASGRRYEPTRPPAKPAPATAHERAEELLAAAVRDDDVIAIDEPGTYDVLLASGTAELAEAISRRIAEDVAR